MTTSSDYNRADVYRTCNFVGMLLVVLSSLVSGQTSTGTILGVVTDPSGSVIPKANVTAVLVSTNATRTAATNDAGNYHMPALAVGAYTVSAEASGFKRMVVNNVVLTIGAVQRVDIALQLGATTESVTVSGEAPALKTDEASVSWNISSQEVRDLPQQGRDVTALQLLAPGTSVGYPGGGNLGYGTSTGAVVNGGKITQNTTETMDGGDNGNEWLYQSVIKPSIDDVAQFSFQTQMYTAENGTSPSNLAIVTKSGSNSLHGTLYEFFQNEELNARSYFAKSEGLQRVNQFGGNLGGPVIRDKLFFFFNYEGLRNRTPGVINTPVPTDAERQGDFSGTPYTITDPSTGQPFPGNQIPADRFSPYATALLADGLIPRANTDTNFWRAVAPSKNYTNQYTGKIDYNLPHDNQFFGRYTFNDFFNGQDLIGQPLLPYQYKFRFQNIVLGETQLFGSGKAVNEFRFTFHRERVLISAPNPKNTNFVDQIGATTLTPNTPGFPLIIMSNFGLWGNFPHSLHLFNTFNVSDGLTFMLGSHTLKVGGSFQRLQSNASADSFPDSQGEWSFTGLIDGNDWADLLLGNPTLVSWETPPGPIYDRWNNFGGYIQDDWKASSRLTLNFGLRYDLFGPQTELHNRISSIDIASGKFVVAGTTLPNNLDPRFLASFPAGSVVPASDIPGLPVRSLRGVDYHNFGPRFGFAWRPFPSNKTVIRGGYGRYYVNSDLFADIQPGGMYGGRLAPWQADLSVVSTNPDISVTDPFANAAHTVQLPGGTFRGGANFPNGYYDKYSLHVERELLGGVVGEIGYVGGTGGDLPADIYNYNDAPPGDPNTVQARRRFPNFGPITYHSAIGTVSYNSMQVRVEKRSSRNLIFGGNYTYGRQIVNTGGGQGGYNVIDPLRPNAWRSPGNWDVTHRVSVDWVWTLPVGAGNRFLDRGGIINAIVGGWQFSGIANIQTGTPFSVTSSNGAVLSGTGTRVGMPADQIGKGSLPGSQRTLQRWFNTSAFVDPQPGTFGNAGLNILRAPGDTNFDLAMIKNFRFREHHQFQFRGEFYNTFNHPYFGTPVANVDSATFGQILSTKNSGRQIQLALKYSF